MVSPGLGNCSVKVVRSMFALPTTAIRGRFAITFRLMPRTGEFSQRVLGVSNRPRCVVAFEGGGGGETNSNYSPYGTQMFLTCVACWRNQRPSACLGSNQSIALPSLVKTCFKLPME